MDKFLTKHVRVIPTAFVDPHQNLEQVRGVPVVRSTSVAAVTAWYATQGAPAPDQVPPLLIFRALLLAREGTEAHLTPPPARGPDYRRVTLCRIARYHRVPIHIEALADRSLLVRLDKPPASADVRLLTPIEAARLRHRREEPAARSFFRPRGGQGYEPYGAYVAALIAAHGSDLGAAVIYPYHELRSRSYQQSRLHHEASRVGVRVRLAQLDEAHLLLTFRDRRQVIDTRDYRRGHLDDKPAVTVGGMEDLEA